MHLPPRWGPRSSDDGSSHATQRENPGVPHATFAADSALETATRSHSGCSEFPVDGGSQIQIDTQEYHQRILDEAIRGDLR